MKEIIGYDPEEISANHERFSDFLHPAELSDMKAKGEDMNCKSFAKMFMDSKVQVPRKFFVKVAISSMQSLTQDKIFLLAKISTYMYMYSSCEIGSSIL